MRDGKCVYHYNSETLHDISWTIQWYDKNTQKYYCAEFESNVLMENDLRVKLCSFDSINEIHPHQTSELKISDDCEMLDSD